MKKQPTPKKRAKLRVTRNLTLPSKDAKAVKGGITGGATPYNPGYIIPCVKNRKPYDP